MASFTFSIILVYDRSLTFLNAYQTFINVLVLTIEILKNVLKRLRRIIKRFRTLKKRQKLKGRWTLWLDRVYFNYREGPFNYQNITETIHEHYIELGIVLNDDDLFWTVRLNEGKEGLW